MGLRVGPKKLNSDALWEYALSALGRRAHSEAELKGKLHLRSMSQADVQAVLHRLREYGMLDDRRFSENYVQARLEGEGFGRQRVLRDLRAKKVSSEIASGAVERAYTDRDEAVLIESYIQRKFRGRNLPEYLADDKGLASAFRRLRLAGFSSGAILAALKRHRAGSTDLPWEEGPIEEEECSA